MYGSLPFELVGLPIRTSIFFFFFKKFLFIQKQAHNRWNINKQSQYGDRGEIQHVLKPPREVGIVFEGNEQSHRK